MSTFDRLRAKIKKDTGLNVTNFKRTYASVQQQGSGAFVWTAEMGCESCGSTVSASELLKQDKIELMEQVSLGGLSQFI